MKEIDKKCSECNDICNNTYIKYHWGVMCLKCSEKFFELYRSITKDNEIEKERVIDLESLTKILFDLQKRIEKMKKRQICV